MTHRLPLVARPDWGLPTFTPLGRALARTGAAASHRNLVGERGGELGEDREAGVKPDET